MKKTFLFLLPLAFLILSAVPLQASQVATPVGGVGWREIGTTVVRFRTDKDEIYVAGNDWFNHLKFRVVDAAVEMINMTVVYENGAPDVIPLAFVIPRGAESRLIDLRGGERRIRKVEFVYRSGAPGFRGRCKIILLGLK